MKLINVPFTFLLALAALTCIQLILSFSLWDSLPSTFPTLFLTGGPTGYPPKEISAFFIPLLTALLGGVAYFFAAKDEYFPHHTPTSKWAAVLALSVAPIFFTVLHVLYLIAAQQETPHLSLQSMILTFSAILALLAVALRVIEPNTTVGLRMGSTKDSPSVWIATHSFLSALFFVFAVVCILEGVACVCVPDLDTCSGLSMGLLVVLSLVVPIVLALLYSYWAPDKGWSRV